MHGRFYDDFERNGELYTNMSYVTIKNLSFAYPDEAEKLILKDIDMNVEKGEFVCLLGQSGCGKSTFLRLLAGLEHPTSGDIFFGEEAINGASLERGMVFQDYGLFPWMTAGENIMLALQQKFPKRSKKELKAIAVNMLQKVGLDENVYRKLPKELSGGMKQRCAIARAFSIDPPVLLMDEPFGALDAVTRARLQVMVLELWAREDPKKTVFFVTHDVDEALLLANRIFVFGQSPSNIIFECSVDKENFDITREDQFENAEIIELRHTLIRHINKDVARRISD